MHKFPTVMLMALAAAGSWCLAGDTSLLHSFAKTQLTDKFWAEGADFGDFNRDGVNDVVAGPYWWAGPEFKQRHEYYPANQTFKLKKTDGTEENIEGFEGALGENNAYSDNFFAFSYDFNRDGWDDILILGFPGDISAWYENPKGREGHWQKNIVLKVTDNESPTFTDLTGDGKPEIVCSSGGYFGYAEPDWADPRRPWTFHPITPKGSWQRFTHGMGVGDVSGDGKMDLLEKDGWWEQPSAPSDQPWTFHKYLFSPGGGAQMYAYDVDGDGDNDVIASVAAHGYGLAWYEHVKENGQITFKEHIFMNKEPQENKYGLRFSQLHAVDLVDMDGDGLKDIVTGKRFWAHGAHGDVEPTAPAVLYWFKLVRGAEHTVDFIPYLIDDNSGVGTQVVARDANGDKYPDIVVGNKKGVFIFRHQVRAVSADQYQKAQPKPYTERTGAQLTPQPVSAPGNGPDRAHINFDDFRFHSERPVFRNPLDPAKPGDAMPPMDSVKFAGLTAQEAVQAATAPPGFALQPFAAEPDVEQPIAFALDDRGRVWVAEGYTYPQRAPEGQGKDRILILEDTDGDHRFDRRTVFIDKLNLVSGLEVGFGGVWVGAAPNFLFIADRDGDDKPDSEPRVVLDGWAWQDTHETLNTFTWGPDGWLYGCHGVFTHSAVGKPGTPVSERTRLNAGVWRYHPTKEQFELFAEGTSNPWGIDFDQYGQCLIEACVIPHFFHMIQGARYQRQAGQHFNPHTYDDIKTIADHVHWSGNKGPHAGNSRSDAAGGGHAHAGLMVYLGDSWPDQYRGAVFIGNIHGQRLNMDLLSRHGSGYIAQHGPDFLNFNDSWSQALNFLYDQNGSAYIIDWYDKNQCHHGNVAGHDRSNGRIYKLVYQNQKWSPVDLAKKQSLELVELQLHKNEFYVRHARRLLQERGPDPAVHAALLKILRQNTDPTRQLRALWALHLTRGLREPLLLEQCEAKNEYVRAWAVQLLAEDRSVSDDALAQWTVMARQDPSPVVRLYLAAALQCVPASRRLPVLEGLLAHAQDAQDHNLPLMYWYAAEPVAGENAKQALNLLAKSKIPLLRQYTTRRMASATQVTPAVGQ